MISGQLSRFPACWQAQMASRAAERLSQLARAERCTVHVAHIGAIRACGRGFVDCIAGRSTRPADRAVEREGKIFSF